LVAAALMCVPAGAVSLADEVADQPPAVEDGVPLPTAGDTVEVSDSNGDLLVCPDGRPLKVTLGDDRVPPGIVEMERVSPEQAREDGVSVSGQQWQPEVMRIEEAAVPRCGDEGGGVNGQPVWVPESVGKDRVVAPERFEEP